MPAHSLRCGSLPAAEFMDGQSSTEQQQDTVAPGLQAVTSFGSNAEDAPAWLRAAPSLARTISSASHDEHDTAMTPPRRPSDTNEEPEWLTDAAKHASSHHVLVGSNSPRGSLSGDFGWENYSPPRQVTPAIERALASTKQAFSEIRSLSADESSRYLQPRRTRALPRATVLRQCDAEGGCARGCRRSG